MEGKGLRRTAIELGKTSFGITPKRFHSIDMRLSSYKFILMMEHPIVIVTIQNQSVVSSPTIGVDGGTFEDFSLNDRHQSLFGTMRNNRHKHLAFPFEKAEHRRLTRRAASPFTANTFRTEVRFVKFKLTGFQRTFFQRLLKIRSRISRKYEFTVFRFTPEISVIASKEQAEGVGQVSLGLQQIDSVVQQNTVSAEQSASASNQMSTMASNLQKIVGWFQLR
jgi:hypothetical protein